MINVVLFECNEKKTENPVGFLRNPERRCIMDYQFQKEICHNCGKPEFCISKGLAWLCHDCFSWSVDYAEQKDLMKQILQDQNIYDLEHSKDAFLDFWDDRD